MTSELGGTTNTIDEDEDVVLLGVEDYIALVGAVASGRGVSASRVKTPLFAGVYGGAMVI